MSDNKKLLAYLFAINTNINNSFISSFDECLYLGKERILQLSTKLIIEIRELIEEGYTFEEIQEMIENCKFEDENLEEDEINFLKRDANKSLKIIYKRGE